jgi:hypothetical protein
MTITGNENTVIKLYKLCEKNDVANLKFKPKTSLNELFKNNNIEKLEVRIDKSLLNNDLEFLDDNGKVLFKTDFEIFEESLEKIL